jgi:D-hydroxyproline dehydrogenase subunit alpha
VKLLTRAGMGWCQGRMCGPAVAGLTGCELTPSRRPFARPVPLGVLARQPEAQRPEFQASKARAPEAQPPEEGTS